VRITCGREGQLKLVVWDSSVKDDDSRKGQYAQMNKN
jgi:hypothetical protein